MGKEIFIDQVFNGFTQLSPGEYESCTFLNGDLANGDISGLQFTNCSFQHCDFSMVVLRYTAFRTVQFQHCKLMGLHFEDCNPFSLELEFEACILNYASFFRLKCAGTVFKDCKMESVDCTEADFSKASFQGCALSKATFHQTKLDSADFRNALHFAIDPTQNSIRKARFSTHNLIGLLGKYGIVVD